METRKAIMLLISDYSREFSINAVSRQDAKFPAVERLVKQRYREVYDAEIEVHAEEFVWLEPHDRPGEGACAAISAAAKGRLFSEQYLDRPCEQIIGEHERKPILRSHVAELGTFAASDPGSGVELFQILPLVAWLRGFRYALLTAVPDITALLEAGGVHFHPITPARADALPQGQGARWGAYYARGPITGYVALEQAATDALIAVLRRRFSLSLLRQRFDHLTAATRLGAGLAQAVGQ